MTSNEVLTSQTSVSQMKVNLILVAKTVPLLRYFNQNISPSSCLREKKYLLEQA